MLLDPSTQRGRRRPLPHLLIPIQLDNIASQLTFLQDAEMARLMPQNRRHPCAGSLKGTIRPLFRRAPARGVRRSRSATNNNDQTAK
jgi:hypothetical protein